ncbi:helix-turn-helix domain-containing protein [Cohnella faecalis]|uniref:Helix-turn-helix domain-containing protein n=1 Tax=Cohnella faecalis TaxID=2315694 RepID=A0A398CN43_9BACL|nr:helix-turn-helix domain-containing protein [Cohnella faecalis]RIE03712.1 helix-turn-helix domain-containing protein [Cohnella faecalis]
MTTFGNRLRNARNGKKLTQTDVAARLGLDFTTISKYENNKSEPDNEILRELANLYEVSVGWLITGSTSEDEGSAPDHLMVNGATELLSDEEGLFLLDNLEMYRLLKAKREKERRNKEEAGE